MLGLVIVFRGHITVASLCENEVCLLGAAAAFPKCYASHHIDPMPSVNDNKYYYELLQSHVYSMYHIENVKGR